MGGRRGVWNAGLRILLTLVLLFKELIFFISIRWQLWFQRIFYHFLSISYPAKEKLEFIHSFRQEFSDVT